MSLGTKVVTEKEQLAQHEENNRFNHFFLLLLLSFSSSFSFFFLQRPKCFIWYYDNPNSKAIAPTSSKSDLTLVNTADLKISKMIVECSDQILLQGQIRWKEDNFKFPECI
jgi:hypothetical protein